MVQSEGGQVVAPLVQAVPYIPWCYTLDSSHFIVNSEGITPANSSVEDVIPMLSDELYGAQWNTQCRDPPTFQLDSKFPVTFSVHISYGSTNAVLGLNVDGVFVSNTSIAYGMFLWRGATFLGVYLTPMSLVDRWCFH